MIDFAQTCPLCSARVADLYAHTAWHLFEGHDMSEERRGDIATAAKAALVEHQRLWEAARDAEKGRGA